MNVRQHFERIGEHEIRPLSNIDYLPLLLELIPTGIVLIDEAFRVREANDLAARMLHAGNGLRIGRNGHLTTEDSTLESKFEAFLLQLLSSATDSPDPKAIRFVAPRQIGLPILVTGASGSHKGSLEGRASKGAILVLREFEERQKSIASIEDLRARYGLTSAEAALTRSLLSGKTLAEHSKECKVSVNTTKTHLRAVLAKTGARRQVDLVRVLGID